VRVLFLQVRNLRRHGREHDLQPDKTLDLAKTPLLKSVIQQVKLAI
jgi:hypothetical protein